MVEDRFVEREPFLKPDRDPDIRVVSGRREYLLWYESENMFRYRVEFHGEMLEENRKSLFYERHNAVSLLKIDDHALYFHHEPMSRHNKSSTPLKWKEMDDYEGILQAIYEFNDTIEDILVGVDE